MAGCRGQTCGGDNNSNSHWQYEHLETIYHGMDNTEATAVAAAIFGKSAASEQW